MTEARPASQITSQTRSNDAYAWTGHGSGSTASVANGLNQLASIGGAATAHDTKGNLTSDPTSGKTYGYSSENLLKTATGGVTLAYDPSMRLAQIVGASTTKFQYDGLALIAEYDAANAITKRYVHGSGVDEPLVEYDGSGTATKRWLHGDERGSVVATSDAAGNMLTINRYDEFGKPQSTNSGRFQYTGQMWLPEVGVYYYKARIYAAHLGRFLQPDPIGHESGPNLYAYVGANPINLTDPLGLETCAVVTGSRIQQCGDQLLQALADVGVEAQLVSGISQRTFRNIEACATHGQCLDSVEGTFSQTLSDCFWEPNCGGTLSGQTAATVSSLISDPRIFGAMSQAWTMSFGHAGAPYTHEHGFWIDEVEGEWVTSGIIHASASRPDVIFAHRFGDADIFFHTHPFHLGTPTHFSGSDLATARIRGILSIMYGSGGFYFLDFRR